MNHTIFVLIHHYLLQSFKNNACFIFAFFNHCILTIANHICEFQTRILQSLFRYVIMVCLPCFDTESLKITKVLNIKEALTFFCVLVLSLSRCRLPSSTIQIGMFCGFQKRLTFTINFFCVVAGSLSWHKKMSRAQLCYNYYNFLISGTSNPIFTNSFSSVPGNFFCVVAWSLSWWEDLSRVQIC